MDYEPVDPSWNPACFTAETCWINLLERKNQTPDGHFFFNSTTAVRLYSQLLTAHNASLEKSLNRTKNNVSSLFKQVSGF